MANTTEAKFFDKLKNLQDFKKGNSQFFTRDKVETIISKLVHFDSTPCKEKIDYYYKNQYLVEKCDSSYILRKKKSNKQIVSAEELYPILNSAHNITGHGGRDAMAKHLSTNFANISREEIVLFTSMCESCQLKKCRAKKSIVVQPILSSELNSRCQVDLIDYQSQPDGEFKFILNYQDHLTKFVRLRAMKTKTAEETASNILEIFCEIGAPHILQCDNGREFSNKVLEELIKLWPQCKIVHGKPRHSQSQGSIERANRDVQDKLACWLVENKTMEWGRGLKFIQFHKNASFHKGIGTTPYEAMFGTPPKLGISQLNFPASIINKIQTEEDLQKMLEDSPGSSNLESNGDSTTESTGNSTGESNSESNREPDGESTSESSRESDEEFTGESLPCIVCENSTIDKTSCNTCFLPVHQSNSCSHANTENDSMLFYTCILCKKKELIILTRGQAAKKMKKQADGMLSNSNKRLKPCNVGDTVLIPIPDVDRAKTDLRNIKGVVLSIENGFYSLGTNAGRINSMFTRNQFTGCTENFIQIEDVPDENISIRAAASSLSLGNGQGFFKCNCKTKCLSKLCKCKKNNVKCNSKCHQSNTCSNKH